MGSDSAAKHRQRAPGRLQTYFRLAVVVAAVTTLWFFTRDPQPLRLSHQLERQNARRFKAQTVGPAPVVTAQHAAQDTASTHDAVALSTGEQQGEEHDGQALTKRGEARAGLHARGVYRLTANDIDGVEQSLAQYMGQVSIIVNVASKCGYTASNYQGLQAAYESFKDKGFSVLAFPCNQFGGQEPGTEAEIKEFAASKGATFPLFSKVSVNGAETHPVWEFLKLQPAFRDGGDIRWNFEKALIGRNGQVVKRYGSSWDDAQMRADIEDALKSAYDEADAFR